MSDVKSYSVDIRDRAREMQAELSDPLRTRKEFAAQGKFGLKTLSRIEARGEGPAYVEITPGLKRYRQSSIDAWFEARTVTGARPFGKTPTEAIEARQQKRRGAR
jgi:hypothetical protein